MTGLSDLIDALLDAREHRNASAELCDYATHRYLGMVRAFGLGDPPAIEHVDPWDMVWGQDLKRLFVQALNAYEQLASPFDGYLEVSGDLATLYRAHGTSIERSLDAARAKVRALLLEALVLGWGLPADMTVTDDELLACGFDPSAPAPDPHDFF